MKKLMMAMAAAAMVGAANAEISVEAYITPYADKDTSPTTENGQAWYSLYAMKLTDAQTMSGASEFSAITKWLGNNFAVNSEKVRNSSAATSAEVDSYSESNPGMEAAKYIFKGGGVDIFGDETDIIAFCFFDNGTDEAYKVLGDSEQIYFNIGDSMVGSFAEYNSDYTSGWQAVNVPEPTSGLLMLLGMAGLALKRKQRG